MAIKKRNILTNFIINLFLQIINIILMLYVRREFSLKLGDDVLGLNSIYSSLLSFLALSELGIGAAVEVCLYKALAEKDYVLVTSFMYFLKKVYTIIGLFIIGSGLLFIPFLHFIIKENFSNSFLIISFFIYVLSVAVSYFYSYKRIIYGADQRNYVISLSQLIYKVILASGQLLIIIQTKNYYYFLLFALLCNFCEPLILSLICDSQYPYLKNNPQVLNSVQKNEIKSKVTGIICYKVSDYIIQSTDNIIISIFLGATMVAYYTNYFLITNIMFAVFVNLSVSLQAGFGNIAYTDENKLEPMFFRLLLIQQYIFSFTATAFFLLSSFFIKMIFPTAEIFSLLVLFLIVMIYWIRGYSGAIESVRGALAEYSDRYIILIISICNILFSVLFIKQLGLASILIGTIFCYILKEFVILPYIVFSKIFKTGKRRFYFMLIKNFLLTFTIIGLLYTCTKVYEINSWLRWCIYGFLSFILSMLINTVFYFRTKEFKSIFRYILKFVNKEKGL